MKIKVNDWFDDLTICGFERNLVEFAYQLWHAGITPYELKEHYHDFEWCMDIINKEYDKILVDALTRNMSETEINKIIKPDSLYKDLTISKT